MNTYILTLGYEINEKNEEEIRKKNRILMSRIKGTNKVYQNLKKNILEENIKIIFSGRGQKKIKESEFMKKMILENIEKNEKVEIIKENFSLQTSENFIFSFFLILKRGNFFSEKKIVEKKIDKKKIILNEKQKLDIDLILLTSCCHLRRSLFYLKLIYLGIKKIFVNFKIKFLEDKKFDFEYIKKEKFLLKENFLFFQDLEKNDFVFLKKRFNMNFEKEKNDFVFLKKRFNMNFEKEKNNIKKENKIFINKNKNLEIVKNKNKIKKNNFEKNINFSNNYFTVYSGSDFDNKHPEYNLCIKTVFFEINEITENICNGTNREYFNKRGILKEDEILLKKFLVPLNNILREEFLFLIKEEKNDN